jgi:hypothetical protein
MADQELTDITVGETLFVFEGNVVRVFGRDGGEATFPLSDFEAFVEFLAARLLGQTSSGRRD